MRSTGREIKQPGLQARCEEAHTGRQRVMVLAQPCGKVSGLRRAAAAELPAGEPQQQSALPTEGYSRPLNPSPRCLPALLRQSMRCLPAVRLRCVRGKETVIVCSADRACSAVHAETQLRVSCQCSGPALVCTDLPIALLLTGQFFNLCLAKANHRIKSTKLIALTSGFSNQNLRTKFSL